MTPSDLKAVGVTLQPREGRVRNDLDALGFNYTRWLLERPHIAKHEVWYSQLQYCNAEIHMRHLKEANSLRDAILAEVKPTSILNVGTGAGYLEHCIKRIGKTVGIDTVEWDQAMPIFELMRNTFEVDVNYIMPDVFSDNWEIYGCNKQYDLIVFQRFMVPAAAKGIDQKLTIQHIYDILSKFSRYGKRFIICCTASEHVLLSHIPRTAVSRTKKNSYVYANIQSVLNELKSKIL
jgi:hypothetical protein